VCGCAGCDGPHALGERHRFASAGADRLDQVEVLHVAGPLVEVGVGHARIHRGGDLAHRALQAGRARAHPFAEPHGVAGDRRLELRPVAGDDDLLLVAAAFGEHAQVERAADAVGELDDHERVVEHVRALLASVEFVGLVEVVDVLSAARHHPDRVGAGDEVHQVEEVAALLDERAAGEAVEPVPVADLLEEREPVLADRHHPGGAAHPGLELFEHHCWRRHVAVLQAHPGDGVAVGGGVDHPPAVVDGGAQRLLDQDVLVGGERVGEDVGVGEVRRDDDDDVDVRIGEQLAVVAVGGDLRPRLLAVGLVGDASQAPLEARVDGVGEGDHLGALDVVEVEDVLAAHHPRADDAVADGVAHARDGTSRARAMTGYREPNLAIMESASKNRATENQQ
jgi:hypothetical protein